ncbi:MAG: cytochrome-c peroxidase [Acidobacteria bacterium]|nr:cytochrome-c peroxidase [Acidobacteriota bacterium]
MARSSIKLVVTLCSLVAVQLTIASGAGREQDSGQPPTLPAIPLGLPADTWRYWVPADNPLTLAKVALGRRLFFDRSLSLDGTVSCADCHQPSLAFTDGRSVAVGIGGRRGTRNSMSLLNVVYNTAQFWDGRVDTLEEQSLQPLVNSVEMGNHSVEEVVVRLAAKRHYQTEFRQAFGGEIDATGIARAIASYERTLLSGNSPFDRFQAGDEGALTPAARRGMSIFRGRGRCSRCHTITEFQPLFTNFAYQNTGVAARHPNYARLAREAASVIESGAPAELLVVIGRQPGGDELGRALRSSLLFEIGSYRTPGLRNVGVTAPYFHDGSARTLADVVRFYNDGGRANLNLEEELHPLGLSEREVRELVEFLESLTGEWENTTPSEK